jgi:hypothetical protein
MTVRKLMKVLEQIEHLQRQLDAVANKEPDRFMYTDQTIYLTDLVKWETRMAEIRGALDAILDQEFP